MSEIAQQLLQQIDSAGDGATVSVRDGGDRLVLGLAKRGQMALSLTELRLETERLKGASVDRVREVADELTKRVSYLLEPLTPVEIDRELAVVQMRSTEPTDESEGPTYFEVLVKTGGSIAMRRYRKPRASIREPVEATVTREVLTRLVGDFLGSVGA